MAIETVNPTTHDNPDPAFGGVGMGISSNTGCTGAVIGQAGADNHKSYRAYSFATPVHLPTERRLKFSWEIQYFDATTGTVRGEVEYTLDAGSSWVTIADLTNTGGSGSVDVLLSSGQALNLVQVRGELTGSGPITDPRQMSLVLSSIRVEVTYSAGRTGAGGGVM